jgi:anti-sigma-K factor RskA
VTCHDARELLAHEDLGVALEPGTPLAEHLAGCADCRRLAEALRADLAELGVAYRAIDSSTPARTFAERAMAAASDTTTGPPPAGVSTIRRGRWTWMLIPVGIAAAAVLAVVGNGVLNRGAPTTAPLAAAVAPPVEPGVTVEVPNGHNAIVFETKNPKISVVWIY